MIFISFGCSTEATAAGCSVLACMCCVGLRASQWGGVRRAGCREGGRGKTGEGMGQERETKEAGRQGECHRLSAGPSG